MDKLQALVPTLLLLAACAGAPSSQPIDAGSGPNPALPQPESKPIPTVNIAPAKGWSGDQKPSAAAGFAVSSFAADLDHPRWLYVLPNGDVLVAETNRPPKQPEPKGISASFMRRFFKNAGAAVPSANRITLLRDADGDGVAETRSRVPPEPLSSVRHGAGRQRPLRRQRRCASSAFRIREGATPITEAPGKSPTCPAA